MHLILISIVIVAIGARRISSGLSSKKKLRLLNVEENAEAYGKGNR